MIKILHVNTTKEWRGGDIQMFTTYELLNQYADIQQLIFCPGDSKMSQALEQKGVFHLTAIEKKKVTFRYFLKIKAVVKAHKIDILHAHDSYALTLALLVARFHPQLKIVYSRKRNNSIKKGAMRRLKFNSTRLNKIVCVSQGVKNIFEPVLKDQNKAIVIYDGIDVELIATQPKLNTLRKEFNLSSDTLLIGNIAALTPQKDLFTFIDAAAAILKSATKDVAFIIIGDGYLKERLMTYAQEKGIADKMLFAGFRSEAYKLLKEFDALMMSSETEGLPLVVFEAFAAKVPVVATDAGGTAEAVIHGETGLLSPVADAKQLALNALQFLENDELVKTCVSKGFEKVNKEFQRHTMGQHYYRLYKDLIN